MRRDFGIDPVKLVSVWDTWTPEELEGELSTVSDILAVFNFSRYGIDGSGRSVRESASDVHEYD